MKNFLSKFGECLVFALFFPFLLLFLLSVLLYLPIDYIRYRRSLYWKDTKEQYHAFGALSPYFVLYNLVKSENIPLEFFRDPSVRINAFGYFRHRDLLILCDCTPYFHDETQEWFVEENDEAVSMETVIRRELDHINGLAGISPCKRAVVLVDRSKLLEVDCERIPECNWMLVYETKQNLGAVLRAYLDGREK